ncbi:MAG: hypothetical protein HY660_09700 [Armatimonadetes bacterium]|nr:hypothetical protein [Armatimonadota bacterium]
MNQEEPPSTSADLIRIVESARRLGVEIDEAEALQWLAAMASWRAGDTVAIDSRTGVFGHRVVMLDFSPEELDRYRAIGRIVEIRDRPGIVETALALSGSAAQSKIQTYPGDCDYFERVNIKAESREQACTILAEVMREKVASSAGGPGYQLIEVKFGSYPYEVFRQGRRHRVGAFVSWSAPEAIAGRIQATRPDGTPVTITWAEAAADPGWCKLDWVIVDPLRGQLANASNMLDVTWEAPDGRITPLDGYLDPYFQEVYLEADSIPLFSKIVRQISADAVDEYVARLEGEVRRYLAPPRNYGKAAKRMYNIFRLNGQYQEAAYLRELFDEPATMLYQVWSLIRTLDDAVRTGAGIPAESLLMEVDRLIVAVVEALEGSAEAEIVRDLLRLRTGLTLQGSAGDASAAAEVARGRVLAVVNEFFRERLAALPPIKAYMDRVQA